MPLVDRENLLSLWFCRRSRICGPVRRTLAKRSFYGPGDGDVAGVTLPAGNTPAPESGTAEEPDPGEAWTGAVAGEPGEG